jgi:3-isopropylmalate/(R)-2-methylmalate dehydratase small subunit
MMRRFTTVEGVAALLDQDNIDTDQVLPSAFMRGIEPDYGAGLFALWRRDPNFVLSRPGFAQTKILVAGKNFGCGSTREHACWALDEFGIRVLIAESFGEVFRDNCVKNGILPITVPALVLEPLRDVLRVGAPRQLRVDLMAQRVTCGDLALEFEIPPTDKTALIEGLDEIGMTLLQADAISAWEQAERHARPWRQSLRALT